MMKRYTALRLIALAGPLLLCCNSRAEQPSQEAIAGFNKYVGAIESRLAAQHRKSTSFIALTRTSAQTEARLRGGELVVENLTPTKADLPGATIYHWRGTAFVAGATVADFERLMRDFPAYPRIYSPQVVSSRVLSQNGDHYQVAMRVKQKHIITVVMDTNYDVEFAQLDARHGWSTSRSTGIDEIEDGRVLSPADQHGFLWRLNTYWTFEQRNGGLYMQIESVSLTRSIPTGLGWAVEPFVQSVPRESLEFTLRATRDALRK
ncbi:MAG TPA: hypothetical protein VGT04_16555 [Acidobacteriaceae bacterium]|nr:hypothetical protein [Acidobacteriaceae bacterium]